MSRDQLHPGYVLHRRDYSDTSLLVEAFTAVHGKLPLVAKGARRPRRGGSNQAALLQPFVPLLLAWSGRGEVKTLTRVESVGQPPALVGDALYCGFYVNELLMRLLGRQDADQVLFAAYQGTLKDLALGPDQETPLRRFELTLLGQLGYRPPLDRDADAGKPVERALRYILDSERGPVRAVTADSPASVSGATLLDLHAGRALSGDHAREARDLMRRLLAAHLGGRPLLSRALFAARRRSVPAPPQAIAEPSFVEDRNQEPKPT